MRSAVIVQVAVSKSISDQSTPRASSDRAAVRIKKRKHSLLAAVDLLPSETVAQGVEPELRAPRQGDAGVVRLDRLNMRQALLNRFRWSTAAPHRRGAAR